MTNKKGFLGFLSNWGAVTEEDQKQKEFAKGKENEQAQVQLNDEMVRYCTERLEDMLRLSMLLGKVKLIKADRNSLYYEIFDSGDDSGRIIGKNGGTLVALQFLLRQFMFRRYSSPVRVYVDSGDYRNRRISQLKKQALQSAEEVKIYGKAIELEAMDAYERRAIHMLFQDDQYIKTESYGNGNSRHIVLEKRATDS